MLHLLTETQKNKVIKEYRMRLVVVICWLITFISLTGIALLIPSYLTAYGKVNLIKRDNQTKEDSVAQLRSQNFKDKIKQVDFNLQALKSSINIISPKEVYDKIISSLPPEVYVNRYTYNLIDSDTASISIDGLAPNRDKLIELQKNLKENPDFDGISIPISSFTKKTDLSFSLKFNLIKAIKK